MDKKFLPESKVKPKVKPSQKTILERTGSNPGHGLCGDWASIRCNGFQVGGLSDRRYPLGGLL